MRVYLLRRVAAHESTPSSLFQNSNLHKRSYATRFGPRCHTGSQGVEARVLTQTLKPHPSGASRQPPRVGEESGLAPHRALGSDMLSLSLSRPLPHPPALDSEQTTQARKSSLGYSTSLRDGWRASRYNPLSQIWKALSTAWALARHSLCSRAGMESATIPAPA